MFNILNVEVSIVALVLAVIVNMVWGILWYSPFMFGKWWTKLSGRKMESSKMTPMDMALALLVALVLAIGLNSVLQYSAIMSGLNEWVNVFATAFMVSTTFCATTLANEVLWEGKRKQLAFLNYLHLLTTCILMCAVLTLFF